MSLRYKILSLFILAIILPALLVSIIITTISRHYIADSIFDQQKEVLKRVADRISSQIDRHQQLLFIYRDISSSPGRNKLSAAKEIFSHGSAFSEIAILNSGGQELWKYSRSGPVRRLVNRSKRGEYQSIKSGQSFISSVFFTAKRSPYIILSVPLLNRPVSLRGEAIVVVAKLDLSQMWQWISEIKIGETGHVFVVEKNGNLIAHREPERVWAHSDFGNLPVVRDFINRQESSPDRWSEYRDERGEKVVALYQSLPKLNWAVISQIPYKEVYAPVGKMNRSIILWTLFWTGVFLFIGLKFVQRITNPLAILQSGVQKISRGKLDIKLDIRTGDEIEELALNFEKMACALKQLEELRQDLIRMIIHDLKSPLSGIMGGLDYLESGLLGEFTPEQKKIISVAKKSSETMLVMIQNLLDIAKMEEGKLELRKDKADIANILKERKTQFEALASSEGKFLSLEIGQNLEQVEMDSHLIERVINNLLTNALNHTPRGGKINLKLRKLDNCVEVSVSDNGVGIPSEYLDKIFEKFVQVSRKQAHLRTGAGLGLTFCKMVVETHGGQIRVESEMNKGSSFIFTLPT